MVVFHCLLPFLSSHLKKNLSLALCPDSDMEHGVVYLLTASFKRIYSTSWNPTREGQGKKAPEKWQMRCMFEKRDLRQWHVDFPSSYSRHQFTPSQQAFKVNVNRGRSLISLSISTQGIWVHPSGGDSDLNLANSQLHRLGIARYHGHSGRGRAHL